MLLRQMSSDEQDKIGKLFATGKGKDVLDILNKVFYNTISFTPGDPHTASFKEGQRDVVQVFRTLADSITAKEK